MCLLFFFSTIQLAIGLCCRGVRVSMGPLSADTFFDFCLWLQSAPSGPIGTPDPTTTKTNRQLDGGEEKQQTHGELLGTKLEG